MANGTRPQHFIADAAGLEQLCQKLASERVVGLDTESNGFHAYVERLCLVQLSTADADYVLDPIALSLQPLVPLLSDATREVILHAAEFDVVTLRRELNLVIGRLFDTHAAAKVLGIARVGLGNLVQDELGIALTEDEQRSDWGQRPLTQQQLAYAFADVRHLLALRDTLHKKLTEAGRLREAEAEFERLRHKEARPRAFDPEGWMKMKAARTLDGKGRAVLAELYRVRDNRARDLDRPPFKVLSDLFLAEVARRLPKELSQLQGIPGASPRQLEKTGPMLLEGIQRGLAAPPVNKLRQPGNDKRGQKPSPEIEERYERLRAWRKAKAEARKVEVQVITPNTVLMGIAKADPRTLEALGQVEGMDAFRLEQHGAEILAQLTSSAPAPKPAQLSLVDG